MQPLKPITIDLKGAVDRFIGNLGYTKARLPRLTPDILFAGETTPGEEHPYSNWSDDQWERLAITSSWVFSDIQLIAQEVSQGVFEVQERDQKAREQYNPVEAHPFEAIIEGTPNPDMSQSFTWQYIAKWLLLRGEAYWMLVPDRSGDLISMYPLPANRLKPLPDPTGQRLFGGFAYQAVSGARPQILLPEQVCFHRFPNPWQYRRGLSPISAYRLALQSDHEAARLGLDDLENGLTLRALISTRADLSDNEFYRARDEIKRGQLEGDRYLVAPAGEIDIKPLTIKREDAEFLASREFNQAEIDRIYGIPGGFWSGDANRANVEGAIEILRTFTIWPLMELLAQDITTQVILRYYEGDLRGRFKDIRPVNRELLIKEEEHQRRAMTFNEVRAKQGLGDHPDPDIGNAPFEAAKDIARAKVALAARRLPQTNGSLTAGQPEQGDSPDEDEAEEKALRADLKRWQSVALRRFRRGQPPGKYAFESEYIPAEKAQAIQGILATAASEQVVKQAFVEAEPFIPEGAAQFNPVDETEDELAERAEDQAEATSQAFDEIMPELATLLEAEEEGVE